MLIYTQLFLKAPVKTFTRTRKTNKLCGGRQITNGGQRKLSGGRHIRHFSNVAQTGFRCNLMFLKHYLKPYNADFFGGN